jgi:hypothetical protein
VLVFAVFSHFLFVKESTVAYCVSKDKWLDPPTFFQLGQADSTPLNYDLRGGTVGVAEILSQIDKEIAQLQHARALLAGKTVAATKKTKVAQAAAKPAKKKKRNLSPEGRKRIAEAVKKRWAEQKKAASAS